jgi:hypothetical protein
MQMVRNFVAPRMLTGSPITWSCLPTSDDTEALTKLNDQLKSDLLYDIVNTLLWDKDGLQYAQVSFEVLVKHKDRWPAEAASITSMAACLRDQCTSLPLNEAVELRAFFKATGSRLIRQFCSLPLGAPRLALLDCYILQLRKDDASLTSVQQCKRQLESADTALVLRSGDAPKIAAHFSAMKKTFIGVVATCKAGLAGEHPDLFKSCTSAFDSAIAAIATVYFTALDKLLYEYMTAVTAFIAKPDGEVKVVMLKELQGP